MKTEWIDTRDFYHQIIAAPDQETREQLYRDLFIQPWKPMMEMIGPMFKADPADDFSVARAWAWLLPDDLTSVPDSLRRLEAADAWRVGGEALAEGAARFAPYADRIPFDTVSGWLVLADPTRSDPIGRGYTGATDFTHPRFVAQFDTPSEFNLPRLPGLVVHEMHHLIRNHVFPWDMSRTSVGDYIIVEGLAEAFAAELFGEKVITHFAGEISADDLATARHIIGENLDRVGFSIIRAYIFGDTIGEKFNLPKTGVPVCGGYAVGYRVVRAYQEQTGKSVVEATFLPAKQIIEESGYFG